MDQAFPAGLLDGIRVLDFSHQVSGPYCTMTLGDLGADIIKVESPGRGDGIRHEGKNPPEIGSHVFWGANRNKRSITLNLKSPEGLRAARDLAAQSDVLIENFRPGVMDGLGLGYAAVRGLRADIIYVAISAFGHDGPLADRPGMDLIVQAMCGAMGITGESNARPPNKIGPPITDATAALYAVSAIGLALFRRARTGQGQLIRISMLDCALSLMANMATALLNGTGIEGRFGSGHPRLAPYQAYQGADGRWFMVACLTNGFWRRLLKVINRPDLQEEPRFADMRGRTQNLAALNAILEPIFRTRPAREWEDLLAAEDIPTSVVNMPSEALALPQVAHNGMIVEMQHPTMGAHRTLATPLHDMTPPPSYRRHSPILGEHTDELLRELGRSPEEIAAMHARGDV